MPPLSRFDIACLWAVLIFALCAMWFFARSPLMMGIAAVTTVLCVGIPLACWWYSRH